MESSICFELISLLPSPNLFLCSLFLFVWHPPMPPSSSSHSCCQIKCQIDREGGWMAHISPIEVHSMVQYVPASPLLFHSPVCSYTGLAAYLPPPASLAADWVVIVIKSSGTASESTKLSAYGWSSVGGWATEGSRSLSPKHSPPSVSSILFCITHRAADWA